MYWLHWENIFPVLCSYVLINVACGIQILGAAEQWFNHYKIPICKTFSTKIQVKVLTLCMRSDAHSEFDVWNQLGQGQQKTGDIVESLNTVNHIRWGEVHHFVTHMILWRVLRDECWQPFVSEPILLLQLKVQGRTGPRHILATSNALPSSPGLNSPEMDWCKVKMDVLFWQAHMLNWMPSRLKRTGMVWWCVRVSGMGNVHTCGGPINAEGCKQVLEQHILPSTAVTTAWLHRK